MKRGGIRIVVLTLCQVVLALDLHRQVDTDNSPNSDAFKVGGRGMTTPKPTAEKPNSGGEINWWPQASTATVIPPKPTTEKVSGGGGGEINWWPQASETMNKPTKNKGDPGAVQKFNGVWWPLPKGFDQANPDTILETVVSQSSSMPFGNTLKFNKVAIFGDSSSDTRNQFIDTGYTKPDPKKYWNGRVSNGPMWPDYLEKHYSLNLLNFAYGGAVVNNAVAAQGENIPDFFQQVASYLNNPIASPSDTLAIVYFVGNDLKNEGPLDLTRDITTNLQKLVDGGVKNLVVSQGTNKYYLEELKMEQAMVDMVKKFQASHPEVHIELFDTWEFVKRYSGVPPPTASGVWNRGGSKLNCFNQTIEMPCPDPENYIIYDNFHLATVPSYNLAIDLAQFINYKWQL